MVPQVWSATPRHISTNLKQGEQGKLPIVHNAKGTNEKYSYSSIIRTLMYSVVGICFYGVYVIRVVNHFKSSKKHWESDAKKMNMRYVNNRLHQGLRHGCSEVMI